jgi:hypothetical protein
MLLLCFRAVARHSVRPCLLGGPRRNNGADETIHVRQKSKQHIQMNIYE